VEGLYILRARGDDGYVEDGSDPKECWPSCSNCLRSVVCGASQARIGAAVHPDHSAFGAPLLVRS